MELNKKTHQKFIKKIEYNKNKIQIMYGYYGIKAICSGLLSLSQIEASRRIISKVTKKFAKM